MEGREPIVSSIDTAEWVEEVNVLGQPLSKQTLAVDPDTGTYVEHLIYHAGSFTKMHRHHCAHGIYVLKGTLVSTAGIFGPGSMVWFPEGCVMQHGASEKEDCEVLFICNKPFDIEYI